MTNYFRRFGVELEFNSFDNLNRPIGYEFGALPSGVGYIGNLVQKCTNENVVIHKWCHDHNNNDWIIKPDASCGIEICTPVLKGNMGIQKVYNLIQNLKKDKNIKSDQRCSLHIHFDVSDLSEEVLSFILGWWIKCEPIILDAIPLRRRNNQYCEFIGFSNLIPAVETTPYSPDFLIKKFEYKYNTINCFHLLKNKRKTIEFRVLGNEACLDANLTKNWINFMLHFIKSTSNLPIKKYSPNDPFSGYCWLNLNEFFDILEFNSTSNLELIELKNWFITQLDIYSKEYNNFGIFSNKSRAIVKKELKELKKII